MSVCMYVYMAMLIDRSASWEGFGSVSVCVCLRLGVWVYGSKREFNYAPLCTVQCSPLLDSAFEREREGWR
jgi:hypothetical protein